MRTVATFEQWRRAARECLAAGRSPENVHFHDQYSPPELFETSESSTEKPSGENVMVAKEFIALARTASFHRNDNRWDCFYRVLWRMTHGESHLLEIATDRDVYQLLTMEKAVRRDAHKMKAFVRFRRVEAEHGEHFIAWHRPDHRIVRLTAPFFARRFPEMHWSILTPDESVSWVQGSLHYGPGAPVGDAPASDELEELWKDYYRSTFNPARMKLAMMRREMPVRHWATLPEARMIPQMLADAPDRLQAMMARQEGFAQSAADFVPENADWDELRTAAAGCRGCDLCRHATQTVFGEGPVNARIVLVGEQPGDHEDLEGRPFVGPAGQILDCALSEAGINRKSVYLTNAVKHFRHDLRGRKRIHKTPGLRENIACRPWLLAELRLIKPAVLVCLGATAAHSIIGRDFRIHQRRGEVIKTELCPQTMATYHPASIFRVPDSEAARIRSSLVTDLKRALQLAS